MSAACFDACADADYDTSTQAKILSSRRPRPIAPSFNFSGVDLLPVQAPTKYELIVNLKTAKNLA